VQMQVLVAKRKFEEKLQELEELESRKRGLEDVITGSDHDNSIETATWEEEEGKQAKLDLQRAEIVADSDKKEVLREKQRKEDAARAAHGDDPQLLEQSLARIHKEAEAKMNDIQRRLNKENESASKRLKERMAARKRERAKAKRDAKLQKEKKSEKALKTELEKTEEERGKVENELQKIAKEFEQAQSNMQSQMEIDRKKQSDRLKARLAKRKKGGQSPMDKQQSTQKLSSVEEEQRQQKASKAMEDNTSMLSELSKVLGGFTSSEKDTLQDLKSTILQLGAILSKYGGNDVDMKSALEAVENRWNTSRPAILPTPPAVLPPLMQLPDLGSTPDEEDEGSLYLLPKMKIVETKLPVEKEDAMRVVEVPTNPFTDGGDSEHSNFSEMESGDEDDEKDNEDVVMEKRSGKKAPKKRKKKRRKKKKRK